MWGENKFCVCVCVCYQVEKEGLLPPKKATSVFHTCDPYVSCTLK